MRTRQISTTSTVPHHNRLAICLVCATLVGAAAFAIQTANAQSTGAGQVSRLDAQVSYDDPTIRLFAAAAATVNASQGLSIRTAIIRPGTGPNGGQDGR